jgi:hypothetical protein
MPRHKVPTSEWDNFRDLYLTFDKRTLGLTRILLGFFLLFDLFRRTNAWLEMFSNEGVAPAHVSLYRPAGNWSLFHAFTTPPELWVAWGLGLCIYLCVLFGYKTRVAQVLAAIYVASMNGRVLLIENGGYVVQNLLLLWTAFLPMGERFSIDALLASLRRQRERSDDQLNDRSTDLLPSQRAPHVSLVGMVICLQVFAIYFFNVVHKTGPHWGDGSAVHYVIYNDRMANPIVALTRTHWPQWTLVFLGKVAMGLESIIPLCLLSPLARVWSRRFVIAGMLILHLGFGTAFTLGPFAWSLCVWATLFFSKEDWELAMRAMRREHRARVVRFDPSSDAALLACRLLKRLDRFELLRFKADPRSQEVVNSDIVAALPMGPLFAWLFRIPPIAWLFSPRFFAFFARPDGSRPRRDGWREDACFSMDRASQWLADDHDTRRWGRMRWRLGVVASVLGPFALVYGEAVLRRIEVDVSGPGPILHGMGWLLTVIGGFEVVSTLMRMNIDIPSSGSAKLRRIGLALRETFIVVMFIAALNQALVELWVARPYRIPQPTATRVLALKLRYLQGWFMFSPNPVVDDGTITVDALTVDGRHIDPFSGEAPVLDITKVESFRYSQIWSDYFNRMHFPANTWYRRPMKEYIYRYPDRTGDPNDAIVSGDVYWVHDMNPRWNHTESWGLKRDKLFSFENPDVSLRTQ